MLRAIFILGAIVSFFVALMLALDAWNGNFNAWLSGGLLSMALSFLDYAIVVSTVRR